MDDTIQVENVCDKDEQPCCSRSVEKSTSETTKKEDEVEVKSPVEDEDVNIEDIEEGESLKPVASTSTSSATRGGGIKKDVEFRVSDADDESDDERTMRAEEKLQPEQEQEDELDALKNEGEMSIEELMNKFVCPYTAWICVCVGWI